MRLSPQINPLLLLSAACCRSEVTVAECLMLSTSLTLTTYITARTHTTELNLTCFHALNPRTTIVLYWFNHAPSPWMDGGGCYVRGRTVGIWQIDKNVLTGQQEEFFTELHVL